MPLEESVENKRISRVQVGFPTPEKDNRSSGQDFRLPKKSPDNIGQDFRLPKKPPDNAVQEFRLPNNPPEASPGISGFRKSDPTTSSVFFGSRKRRTIIRFSKISAAKTRPKTHDEFTAKQAKAAKTADAKNPAPIC